MSMKILQNSVFMLIIGIVFLLQVIPLQLVGNIDSHIEPTNKIESNSADYWTSFYESFILNSANPSQTYILNESIDYLGVFKIDITHTEPRAIKTRGFELNWTNPPGLLYLASRSEVNLDTSWKFYFANLSSTKGDPPAFSVFLRENVTELSLKWMFTFNIHLTPKLSPQEPEFETGSAKRTLNTTMMTFLGVLPESTSNVTFQIEGGYEDENKTFLVSPGAWLIHNVILRAREENETLSFPHTDIAIKLENLSGTASITVFHFKIAWDPDVDQNLDTVGIEEHLAILVVCSALVLLRGRAKTRRKRRKANEK